MKLIILNILYKFLKRVISQEKRSPSREVVLLLEVSMLPLNSLFMFQHANKQHMNSPASYPFSAGELKKGDYN